MQDLFETFKEGMPERTALMDLYREPIKDPYDNAVMECFFKYLKKEETNRRSYSSLEDLQLSLFKYINGFYNSIRPHSHNNDLSPDKKETLFFNSACPLY